MEQELLDLQEETNRLATKWLDPNWVEPIEWYKKEIREIFISALFFVMFVISPVGIVASYGFISSSNYIIKGSAKPINHYDLSKQDIDIVWTGQNSYPFRQIPSCAEAGSHIAYNTKDNVLICVPPKHDFITVNPGEIFEMNQEDITIINRSKDKAISFELIVPQ